MDKAAPVAGAAAKGTRPVLGRVPTSLIVTLAGLA
jgi:hypothetical protein